MPYAVSFTFFSFHDEEVGIKTLEVVLIHQRVNFVQYKPEVQSSVANGPVYHEDSCICTFNDVFLAIWEDCFFWEESLGSLLNHT